MSKLCLAKLLKRRWQLGSGALIAAERTLAHLAEYLPQLEPLQQAAYRLLVARLHLAQHEPGKALTLLEQLLIQTQQGHYRSRVLEIRLVSAVAYRNLQQEQAACQQLLPVLRQAQSEGFLRLFLDEGAAIAALLQILVPTLTDKTLQKYAKNVLQAFGESWPGSALTVASSADSAHSELGLLSAQEQRVLYLLSAGQTNGQIAETLKGATPLMQPRGYRVPAYSRKHFEQMTNWLAGLLVLGDAFSNFNPIYGQGITIAALEAEVLEKCFQEQRFQTSAGFERQMQAAIYPAWWLSIMEDLRWPGVRYIGSENMKGAPIIQKCLSLYLKYATLRNGEQLRNQQFPTYMMKYFMMTAFFISPREILNGVEIDKILTAESTSEERQALASLLQDYAYPQESRSLEEVLQEIVPAFSLAFDKQPV